MATIHYVKNAELLVEVIASRSAGRISNRLGEMMMLMVDRFFLRGNYRHYSYLDELKLEALVQLTYAGLRFNPDKSSNVFAYYTTVMVNAANKVLNRERRHRDIRDDLCIALNLSPSDTRQLEEQFAYAEDEQDDKPKAKRGRPKKGDGGAGTRRRRGPGKG